MPRKRLRLGLLGTGVAARELYLPAFRKLRHRIELVTCASRRRAKALAYARDAGIPEVEVSAEALLERPDLDAVLISLPIDRQPEYVLAALATGKAVLSEKPIAPSLAAGKRLLAAARRHRTPWLVGENFAFMPHVRRLERWLRAGRLGEIRLVQATQITRMDRKNPYLGTAWRKDPKHVGGFVVDGGVHVAEVVRRCFGMPTRVKGLTAAFDAALPPLDTAVAALEFSSGALGTWTSCFSAPYAGPMLRVFGSRASAELDWGSVTLHANGKSRTYPAERDSFEAEFEHFADVVLARRPLHYTPDDALDALALVQRIVEARK